MKTAMQTHSRQKGFSLIEALVAFLILSIGMLGIASLQMVSLKAAKTATLRTVAVVKVEEMMERIRNNPGAVTKYAVGTSDSGQLFECNDYTPPVVHCDGDELAADDIYYWKKELKDALPALGTTASIDVDTALINSAPVNAVTITINWQERDPEAEAMIDMNYSSTTHICDITTC